MSGSAPISVNSRSKDLTSNPVSIKSNCSSSVVFCGMGWEPHCEQLLFRYFCRGEHPRSARGQTLRCKNTVKWGYILISQCPASSASWVFATTKVPVPKLKLLAVWFPTHATKNYTPVLLMGTGYLVKCSERV